MRAGSNWRHLNGLSLGMMGDPVQCLPKVVHPDVAALKLQHNQWCYRETLAPHGWLTEDQVVRKQAELSRTMWAVEYELQEPSAEGRAIDPPAVERMFDATLGTHIPAGDLEHTWRGQSGPPPSGPGRIRPGRGTASASTGPRSATTPSPSSCAAIPRRSRSSPSTASNGDRGRK